MSSSSSGLKNNSSASATTNKKSKQTNSSSSTSGATTTGNITPTTNSATNNSNSNSLCNIQPNNDPNKPQSQINKCLNEKRRREQENVYIEELAELISASIQDMSSLSVKPDKCAILQETVNQIRRIKAAEELAVQQGEVSSSTNILANEILCPLVLEALDGFLFVVNSDGVVEFVSENVQAFVQFTQTDLLGKSIYNVIHLSDHARFSSSLLPMSVGWTSRSNIGSGGSPIPSSSTSSSLVSATGGGPSTSETDSSSSQQQQQHQKLTPNQQRSFNIRVLVKPGPNSAENTSENTTYENMQITAMMMPHPVGPNSPGGGGGGNPTPTGGASNSSGDISENCLVCIARRLPPNERPPGTPVEQFTTKLSTDGNIIGIDTSGLSNKFSSILLKKDHLLHTNTLIQELCHLSDLSKLDTHLRETLQNGSSTSQLYKLKLSAEKYIQIQTKSKFFAFSNNADSDFIMATHTIVNQSPGNESNSSSSSSEENNNEDNNEQLIVAGPSQPTQQAQAPQQLTEYDFDFGSWPELEIDKSSPSTLQQQHTPQHTTAYSASGPPQLAAASSPLPNLAGTWGLEPSQQYYNDNNQTAHQNAEMDELLSINPGTDRLRNLLTLNSKTQTENKILKGLLNQDDEDKDNMLLNLLNSSAEKKPTTVGNELLQQLLGNSANNEENSLKRSLSQMMGNTAQTDYQPAMKLPPLRPPAPGELCKRNPRLVDLLSKQPENNPTIPQVPSTYINSTPQEKLLNQIKIREQQLFQQRIHQQQQIQMQQQQQALNVQQAHNVQAQAHNAQALNAQALNAQQQSNAAHAQLLQRQQLAEFNSDAILDELLDQVIDIVPDNNVLLSLSNNAVYSDDVSNILNMLEAGNLSSSNDPEMAKINAIQKELMQFESSIYQRQHPSPAYGGQQQQHSPVQQHGSGGGMSPLGSVGSPSVPTVPVTAPVFIQRTTTTTTTSIQRFANQSRGNPQQQQNSAAVVAQPPPNQIAPPSTSNQQMLKQQLINQQKQRLLQLQQQQQQNHVSREQIQLIRELQLQLRQQQQQSQSGAGGNMLIANNQQQQQHSLDTLLNSTPPNVTLQLPQAAGGGGGSAAPLLLPAAAVQQQLQLPVVAPVAAVAPAVVAPARVSLTPGQHNAIAHQQLLRQQQHQRWNNQQMLLKQQQLRQQQQQQQQQSQQVSQQQQQQQQQVVVTQQQQQQQQQQNVAQQQVGIQQQNNPMLNAQLNLVGGTQQQQQVQQQQQQQQPVSSTSVNNQQHNLLLQQQQQMLIQQQQQQQQQQPVTSSSNNTTQPNNIINQQQLQQRLLLFQQQQQQIQSSPMIRQQQFAQQQQEQQQQFRPRVAPPSSNSMMNAINQMQQQQQQAQQQQQQLQQQQPNPSNYDIRQELRAIVGARAQQSNATPASSPQQQQQQQNSVPDLEALGFHLHNNNNNPDSSSNSNNLLGD